MPERFSDAKDRMINAWSQGKALEGLKSDILLGATMFFSAMGYLSVEKTTKIVAAQLLIFGCKSH